MLTTSQPQSLGLELESSQEQPRSQNAPSDRISKQNERCFSAIASDRTAVMPCDRCDRCLLRKQTPVSDRKPICFRHEPHQQKGVTQQQKILGLHDRAIANHSQRSRKASDTCRKQQCTHVERVMLMGTHFLVQISCCDFGLRTLPSQRVKAPLCARRRGALLKA